MIDIRDIDGLWCDDITFCQETCGWRSCPRNKQNIRDSTIPHSFSVEIPQDCPKKQEAVEQKTGHWIWLQCCANEGVYCSECHTKMFDRYPMKKKLSQFCGHCGAKMDDEVEGR